MKSIAVFLFCFCLPLVAEPPPPVRQDQVVPPSPKAFNTPGHLSLERSATLAALAGLDPVKYVEALARARALDATNPADNTGRNLPTPMDESRVGGDQGAELGLIERFDAICGFQLSPLQSFDVQAIRRFARDMDSEASSLEDAAQLIEKLVKQLSELANEKEMKEHEAAYERDPRNKTNLQNRIREIERECQDLSVQILRARPSTKAHQTARAILMLALNQSEAQNAPVVTAVNPVEKAIMDWEQEMRSTDPLFEHKIEAITARIRELIAIEGHPETPTKAVDMAKRAYSTTLSSQRK